MAEDIDDLLDEIESKFINNSVKELRAAKTKPSRRKPEDDEIDNMIDDICGDVETEPEEKCNKPTAVRSTSSATGQYKPMTTKCFPICLGGSACSQGFGNSFNKRSCDKLRCTSCDFKVTAFEDFTWDPSVDYLFLRNNAPDYHRLHAKLNSKKGWRAYCCQCQSTAVHRLTDVKDLPQLKWVCGGTH